MTTGPGAVPRLGDPVAHQSATQHTVRGVAYVVSGVRILVRELGGRWGAGRLGAAGFTLSSAASPNQVFNNTKVEEKTTVIKFNA